MTYVLLYLHCTAGASTIDGYELEEQVYTLKNGSSSIGKHLRGPIHKLTENGQPREDMMASNTPSVYTQMVVGSQGFLPEVFRVKLLRFIAVLHLPFSIVEQDEFRDLMLYSSPYLRHDDSLLKSGTSISTSLVTSFLACQVILIALLQQCDTLVHLSFDLWTSPNKYAFLGVIGHFIDHQWKARTVLLGMKPLYSSHAGVDMAQLVIDVIQCYSLARMLGYCVMDNAGDNYTALRDIARWLLATYGVIWDADEHRLRCFGHVISPIANAFTANKPLKAVRVLRAPKGTPKEKKPPWQRPSDAISKLHEVVFFAMRTPARAKEWMNYTTEVSDDFLRPIKDNDTRWFSIYLMLVRAVSLKNTITIFTAQNLTSVKKEDKNLADCIMTKEDWQYCSEVIAFMKPLSLLVKRLEGKEESGRNGFIADVLPAYDYMEEHMTRQLEAFDSVAFYTEGPFVTSMGHTNTLNAQAKLKYYKGKNLSPVLYVACVLIPWFKWEFFEDGMSQAELDQAKTIVRDLWNNKYAGIILESDIIDAGRGDGSAEQAVRVRLLKQATYSNITDGS